MDAATIAKLRMLREAKKEKERLLAEPMAPAAQQQPPPPPLQPSTLNQTNAADDIIQSLKAIASSSSSSSSSSSVLSSSSSSSSSIAFTPAGGACGSFSSLSSPPMVPSSARDLVVDRGKAFGADKSTGFINSGSACSKSSTSSILTSDELSDASTTESFLAVNTDKPIPTHNRGYKLLLKMGWRTGMGIGKAGSQGIVAPVSVAANDTKLGLGKSTQYNTVLEETASSSSDKRRRLEDNRDAETLALRKVQEAAAEARVESKRVELAAFFCSDCNKQYDNIQQWQEHIASYGHAHTRNMKALRAAEVERRKATSGLTKEQKLSKEARREAKALAKRMKAAQQQARQQH